MVADSAPGPDNGQAEETEGRLRDILSSYNVAGAVLGVLVGVWAATTSSLRTEEASVLLAVAGAASTLLGIILAAIALMAGFLKGFYGLVIADIGVRSFFRPFQIVATVSALAALFGFVGAMDTGPGPEWVAVTLFGLTAGFMVASIVGTIGLVGVFIRYAQRQHKLETRHGDADHP